MKDIDRRGLAAVADEVLTLACAGGAAVHVSFDMDVCDPGIAPGVGTPVKGGFGLPRSHTFMEMLAETHQMASLDLVEVNPILDVRNSTASSARSWRCRRWG